MGLLDMLQGKSDELDGLHHASVTHEILGGAVAYEAAKAWNDHCAANGKPPSHAMATQILAGITGAALDRLIETKGLDAWDEHKRKKAREEAERHLNETIIVNEY